MPKIKWTQTLYALPVLPVVLLTIFLTLRRDSNFPFSSNVDSIIVAAYTLVSIIILFALVLWQSRVATLKVKTEERALKALAIGLFLFNVIDSLALLRMTSGYFPGINSWNDVAMMGVGIVSLGLFFVSWWYRKPWLLIATIFIAGILLQLLPIIFFPITAKVADLLPAILKQLESFVQGESIYQIYLLDNGIWLPAVRQPLSALSYLPAFLLGVDIRFMSLLYHLGVGVVLLKAAYANLRTLKFDSKFLLVLIVLICWLLFSYRILRHDLYEPFYWFILALSLFFLSKGYKRLWVVTWGIGIATQVWSWIFTPVIGWYLVKKWGFKTAAVYISCSLLIGLIILATFILPDTAAYFRNVFGSYMNANSYDQVAGVYPMYLVPILNLLNLSKLGTPLLILSCGVVFLAFIRKPSTLHRTLIYLCLLFLAFCMFNRISWNYMYINVVVIMLLYNSLLIGKEYEGNNEKFANKID